jgi:hypothetical protein
MVNSIAGVRFREGKQKPTSTSKLLWRGETPAQPCRPVPSDLVSPTGYVSQMGAVEEQLDLSLG